MSQKESLIKKERIFYLYRATCLLNNKVYIGQTVNPKTRWKAHYKDSKDPKVPFHFAINKYGLDNFNFEIIASCKTQEDANEAETLLVSQYESHISTGKGYNATYGGMNAPKSEEFKKMMREWYASLPFEKKYEITKKQSEATIKQIATKGHPSTGRFVSEEEKELRRKARLENPFEYTDEIRERMSKAHIGNKDSEETKIKKSEAIKKSWEKRVDYSSKRCEVVGCEVSGKAHYRIVNGVRYCFNHGLKLIRSGSLESFKKVLCKDRKIIGNRYYFNDDEVEYIINCGKSVKELSEEFKVTEKVIRRVRKGL